MPMIDLTSADEIADDARLRTNVVRLAAAQALTGANSAVIFATGSIVGATLAPDMSFATVPISMYVVGLAAGTLPTGAISRRFGRRVAFVVGTGCGVLTGVLFVLRPSSADSTARWRNPIALPRPTAPVPPTGRRRCRG
jgi:MFS family permease